MGGPLELLRTKREAQVLLVLSGRSPARPGPAVSAWEWLSPDGRPSPWSASPQDGPLRPSP